MKKQLSVVLFDLGFTLINFEGDFHQAMIASYLALADSLIRAGCGLNRHQLADKFNEVISEYYRCREIDLVERPMEESLKKTLACFDIHSLPEETLQEAIKAMYTYTESRWKIEPDTHSVLSELRLKGYRLGLISNAANSPDLYRLIDNHNLAQYFEVVVTSAQEGIRKPDPQIFLEILNRMKVAPQNAAMVGDTLNADILGALRSGLRSIWITRRADRPENNRNAGTIQPDHTIPDLTSLVPLLEQINEKVL